MGTRLLRALAVWALLLAVTTPMGYFFERHTEEGKKRLDHANQVVAEVLRHAQPAAVAVRFYTRLLQDRGLALYQWGAPMNAAVAREDLAKKYPRLTLICGASRLFRAQTDFTGPDGTPCRLVAPEDPPATPPAEGLLSLRSLTLFPANFDNPPTQPHAWTVLKKESDLERAREAEQQEAKDPMAAAAQAQRAADAADRAAYVAGLARIDRLVLLPFQPPPGSDPMATGRGDAYTTLYTVVLGLPDAYLDLIHGLWPHSAAAVAVVAVALAFLAALMVGQANAWRTLAFLLLVPVAVSLVAGLLSLASWGVYALGHLSWSSLSVTVSAAITSFWSSATPEVVKHQAFEAVKKVLGRRFAVFAEE